MNNPTTILIKNLVIGLVSGFVVALGVYFGLYQFVLTGSVHIQTPAKATVVILKNGSVVASMVSSGVVSTHLLPGSYTAQVVSGNDAQSQTIELRATQTVTLDLAKLPAAQDSVVVLRNPASSFQVAPNNIAYVRGDIFQALQTASSTPLSQPNQAYGAVWNSDQLGNSIVLNSNHYGTIGSHIIHGPDGEQYFVINAGSYNTSKKSFVLISNDQLILLDSTGNYVRTIATVPNPNYGLSGVTSAQDLAFEYYPPYTLFGTPDAHHTGQAAFYSIGSGKAEATINDVVSYAQLSPDASQLAYSTDRVIKLYEVGSKRVISQLDISSPNTLNTKLAWIDNNNFIYNDSRGIWQYDINSHISTRLTTIQNPQTIAAIQAFAGAAYYSSVSTSDPALLRVGATTNNTQKLSQSLPYQDSNFLITYVLVGDRADVTIATNDVQGNLTQSPAGQAQANQAFNASVQQHRSQALSYLQSKGIDSAKLNITYTPGLAP